jgi:hypothetical protein
LAVHGGALGHGGGCGGFCGDGTAQGPSLYRGARRGGRASPGKSGRRRRISPSPAWPQWRWKTTLACGPPRQRVRNAGPVGQRQQEGVGRSTRAFQLVGWPTSLGLRCERQSGSGRGPVALWARAREGRWASAAVRERWD